MRHLFRRVGNSLLTSTYLIVCQTPCFWFLPSKGCIGSSPRCIVIISGNSVENCEILTTIRRKFCSVSGSSEELQRESFSQVLCAVLKSPKAAKNAFTCANKLLKGDESPPLDLVFRDEYMAFGHKVSDLLIASSGKEFDFTVTCHFFMALVLSTESLPSSCYLSFAACFVSTPDCSPVLNLVKNVVKELPSSSGKIVVNRIIFAFGESRQPNKALSIFSWMKESVSNPDLVTYNIVLEILGRAGKVEEMVGEFESMARMGISPDFISFNTLLNQLRIAGRLDLCLNYYNDMLQRGIHPDLLTFTALIGSLGRSGNVEDALRLFNDMKERDMRPSLYVFRSLIASLRKMGKIDMACAMQAEQNSSILARPSEFKRRLKKC